MKVVRLMTCETSFEANLIKGRLENEGVDSFLTNENFSTLMPHYNRIFSSGVQVMILEKDLEKASLILSSDKKEEVICPACSSANIEVSFGKNKIKKLFFILLSLFAAVPFNNINNVYHCQECKAEF